MNFDFNTDIIRLIAIICVAALSIGFAFRHIAYAAQLNLKREATIFSSQTALARVQRQIEEFYAPLLALVKRGAIINDLETLRVSQEPDSKELLIAYFREEHYLPLNTEIAKLLYSKTSLMKYICLLNMRQ